jgi:hypothetical protein
MITCSSGLLVGMRGTTNSNVLPQKVQQWTWQVKHVSGACEPPLDTVGEDANARSTCACTPTARSWNAALSAPRTRSDRTHWTQVPASTLVVRQTNKMLKRHVHRVCRRGAAACGPHLVRERPGPSPRPRLAEPRACCSALPVGQRAWRPL